MIKNLRCIDNENYIGSFENEGETIYLTKEAVRKYWKYEEDGTHIKLHSNGSRVWGTITIAQGQAGVVVVWNCQGEIEHITNGEFAVDSEVNNGFVYTLADIAYFGRASTVKLYRSEFGKKDISNADEMDVNIPEDLFRFKGIDPDTILLQISKDGKKGRIKAADEVMCEFEI